ncbi:MAG: hypothetical protein WC644_04125 [Ignavibacteria bacterium]
MNKSIRRQRFENVASRRTQRILDSLDLLSNCSNRSNYDFNDDDVKKMFTAIREKIKSVEAIFDRELNKQIKYKFNF